MDRKGCPKDLLFEQTVEVGSDQPRASIASPGQVQQSLVGCGCSGRTQVWRENARHSPPNSLTPDFSLKQPHRGVVLLGLNCRLLHRTRERRQTAIKLVYQSTKSRQACRIGDACPTKEHHAPFLVCLQQTFGNVGAVLDELRHSADLGNHPHPGNWRQRVASFSYRGVRDLQGDDITGQAVDSISVGRECHGSCACIWLCDQSISHWLSLRTFRTA
ncbi:hypothetical protein D3C81_1053280 [compost metagenome]